MTDRSVDGSGNSRSIDRRSGDGGPENGDPGVPSGPVALRAQTRLTRKFFARDPLVVARDLIGREIVAGSGPGRVVVRLSEVEAYAGADDPASHAYRGQTARTAVMFGPAGFLYVYFVYGMHWCANVVTGATGPASAVLLRAGRVTSGTEAARQRRPKAIPEALARGPAALTGALGITGADNCLDLCKPGARIHLRAGTPAQELVRTGPRVGVSAAGDRPWRFFRADDPSVSRYRAGTRRGPVPPRNGPAPVGAAEPAGPAARRIPDGSALPTMPD